MIILITGASLTGKTLLAQRMLEEYRIPYVSIDHLKMGLIRCGMTDLTPEDDEALTDYLWPIVREIIKTAIENRQNLIVEGCYIPFDWRKDFDEKYSRFIRFVCLAMTDSFIDAHFNDIRNHASDIETRLYEVNFLSESLKEDNHYYINGFTQYGEPVMLIDTDYEDAIKSFIVDNGINNMMTINTTDLCSHLQKKLFEEDGIYHHIWIAMQDDPELTAVVRSRQLHIYRNGKKVLVLAGKAAPKFIREDRLCEMLAKE